MRRLQRASKISHQKKDESMRSKPNLVFGSPSDELALIGFCGSARSAPRQLTSRGCLNAAAKPRSEFCATPQNPISVRQPLRSKGRVGWVAFLLPTFLWRSKEQVGRPPGRDPASRHAVKAQALKRLSPEGPSSQVPRIWLALAASWSRTRTMLCGSLSRRMRSAGVRRSVS
jgi:hypothetical protein